MSGLKRQAQIVGRAVVIEMPPEMGGEKALVAEIQITCPDCGDLTYRVAGHHLKSIRDLLIAWIDEFPELCGGESRTVPVKTTFGGTPPRDPSVN